MGKRQNSLSTLVSEAQMSLLRLCMNPAREAGKAAMKEVRKSIVNEWFGSYSSGQMNDATKADAHVRIIDGKRLLVNVYTWVDPASYMWKQKILKWNERRGVWSSPEAAIEYMLDLQLERGIIGLPAKGTRPVPEENRWAVPKKNLDEQGYWHNPDFVRRGVGLRQAIEESSKWTDGTFVNIFNDKFRKGVK